MLKIDICCRNRTISQLNVYLPYDNGTNIHEYQHYISKVDSILSDNPYSCAIGDFNANISDTNSRFGNELKKYCMDENLMISNQILAPSDSFTFFSEAHGSVAWLDHVISTSNMHSIIEDIWVDYHYISSDHLPVLIRVNVGNINATDSTGSDGRSKAKNTIQWDRIDQQLLEQYKDSCSLELSRVPLNHSLLLCDNTLCTDMPHRAHIDTLYNDTVGALISASEILRHKQRKPYRQVAGWREICAELHSHARNAFLLWINSGKPRYGQVFYLMKSSRAKFKQALRECKSELQRHTADSLATKLLNHNSKSFWTEIKKVINKDHPSVRPETIEGHSGEGAILDMWKEHFKSLLNTNSSQAIPIDFDLNVSYARILPDEVKEAISSLKSGKTSGLDGIYAEHLKHMQSKLSVYISLVFNAMLIHNYLPSNFMKTSIIPIVKDKKVT